MNVLGSMFLILNVSCAIFVGISSCILTMLLTNVVKSIDHTVVKIIDHDEEYMRRQLNV